MKKKQIKFFLTTAILGFFLFLAYASEEEKQFSIDTIEEIKNK
jgi:hypothetical protein